MIQWIVIYPLHSTIKPVNNWGHKCMTQVSIRNGMRPTGLCYYLFVELTVCVKCKLLLQWWFCLARAFQCAASPVSLLGNVSEQRKRLLVIRGFDRRYRVGGFDSYLEFRKSDIPSPVGKQPLRQFCIILCNCFLSSYRTVLCHFKLGRRMNMKSPPSSPRGVVLTPAWQEPTLAEEKKEEAINQLKV